MSAARHQHCRHGSRPRECIASAAAATLVFERNTSTLPRSFQGRGEVPHLQQPYELTGSIAWLASRISQSTKGIDNISEVDVSVREGLRGTIPLPLERVHTTLSQQTSVAFTVSVCGFIHVRLRRARVFDTTSRQPRGRCGTDTRGAHVYSDILIHPYVLRLSKSVL